MVVFDLLQAYEVVLEAPFEEQQALFDAWRENTTQTLDLILSPDECEAWEAFSAQDVDWDSRNRVALQLRSVQAFLRALTTAGAAEGRRRRRDSREHGISMNRFTRRASQALERAQAQARRFHHRYIGPAHLLAALAEARNSVSREILNNLGVTAGQVQGLVGEMVEQEDTGARASRREAKLGPALKGALEAAVSEARGMEHHYVDTAHLLLGLIQQEDETVSAILTELGTSPGAVREATMDKIEHPTDRSE
jgi:hypothetical protein